MGLYYDFESIEALADQIDVQCAELETEKARLIQGCLALEASWQGRGFEAMRQQFDKQMSAYDALTERQLHMAGALRKAAVELRQREMELAARLQVPFQMN